MSGEDDTFPIKVVFLYQSDFYQFEVYNSLMIALRKDDLHYCITFVNSIEIVIIETVLCYSNVA